MDGLAIYTVASKEKPEKKNLIEWPEGLVFDNEDENPHGQLFTVRLKPDGEKLCVTEIEGIKLSGYDKAAKYEDDDFELEQNSSGEGDATRETQPVMDGDDATDDAFDY